jgi:hypothetical protein
MKMHSRPFPGCCTASVLFNLGGTDLSQGRKSNFTKAKLAAWLKDEIAGAAGHEVLVVMTNNEQLVANRLLRNLGFKSSKWMKKKTHSNSQVRLWWKEPM